MRGLRLDLTNSASSPVIAASRGQKRVKDSSFCTMQRCILALALGAFQLMFDRGQRNSWFESPETIIELTAGLLAIYLFVVHLATARNPFIKPSQFLNWNYSLGLILAFIFGMLNFVPMVLMPSLLQELRGYPDSVIGILLTIRGAGNMISFMIVVRLAN